MGFTLGSFGRKLMIAGTMGAAVSHEILDILGATVAGRIRSKFGVYQKGWPKLSETTIDRKGFDSPLIDQGDLSQSISYDVHPTFVEIGSTDPVSRYQEFGTSFNPQGSPVPPRPFVGPAADEVMNELLPGIGAMVAATIRKA